MEELLRQEEGGSAGEVPLMAVKPLFVPFRYAPLHKEGFKNSKQYLGLKIKCKFETGLINRKCKLFLGRVKSNPTAHYSTFASPHKPTL